MDFLKKILLGTWGFVWGVVTGVLTAAVGVVGLVLGGIAAVFSDEPLNFFTGIFGAIASAVALPFANIFYTVKDSINNGFVSGLTSPFRFMGNYFLASLFMHDSDSEATKDLHNYYDSTEGRLSPTAIRARRDRRSASSADELRRELKDLIKVFDEGIEQAKLQPQEAGEQSPNRPFYHSAGYKAAFTEEELAKITEIIENNRDEKAELEGLLEDPVTLEITNNPFLLMVKHPVVGQLETVTCEFETLKSHYVTQGKSNHISEKDSVVEIFVDGADIVIVPGLEDKKLAEVKALLAAFNFSPASAGKAPRAVGKPSADPDRRGAPQYDAQLLVGMVGQRNASSEAIVTGIVVHQETGIDALQPGHNASPRHLP